MWGFGLNSSGWRQSPLVVSYEHSNVFSGSIKAWWFLDQLSNCHLLKDSAVSTYVKQNVSHLTFKYKLLNKKGIFPQLVMRPAVPFFIPAYKWRVCIQVHLIIKHRKPSLYRQCSVSMSRALPGGHEWTPPLQTDDWGEWNNWNKGLIQGGRCPGSQYSQPNNFNKHR